MNRIEELEDRLDKVEKMLRGVVVQDPLIRGPGIPGIPYPKDSVPQGPGIPEAQYPWKYNVPRLGRTLPQDSFEELKTQLDIEPEQIELSPQDPIK